ncbi:MAG: type II toxin-antitoxin system VapC family toxin [Gemmatimonadetes bacterium]|nr:type II toxin-antitoxin system VapC family toxin [Gemmatimonadota bacterium]
MIFVDANVPMYLVGAEHPNKLVAKRKLEAALQARERLITDVGVLQEILHRYGAIERRDAIQPAFDVVLAIVDDVYPIELENVERAKGLVLERRSLSALDAIHVAVMEHHDVTRILSFDSGFDAVPGLQRV